MNEYYGKIAPQAKELEDAVLGAIMLERDAFQIANDLLNPECFYAEANQRVFRSMQSLAQKSLPIDLLTVVEELKTKEELDLVGGAYYVSKLTNSVVSSANIDAHSRIVLQKYISRKLIDVCGGIIQDSYDQSNDVFEVLDKAEENILKITSKNVQGDMIPISKVLMQAITKIEEWRKNEGTLTGVTSGWPDLDKATRGWQPGDFIVLGARPSVGKTAFALNLVRNAAVQGKKTVAVFSLEMKAVYLALRMMAAESDIYLYRLQTGRMDQDQMNSLIKGAVEKLSQANIFFDENTNINLRILKSKARRLKKKNNLGLIVIDYLQLMSGDNKGNREQQVSEISRGLKNLAQDLDIPIIALSQLSRESEKTIGWDSAPGPSALRESGGIEQDADVIMMLWAATVSEIQKEPSLDGKRKIKIVKARNGVLTTIEFDFKNEIQLFKTADAIFAPSGLVPVSTLNFSESLKDQVTDEQEELPF